MFFELVNFFGAFVPFTELLLNLLQLFAQIVIALGLAHFLFGLALYTGLHSRELEFAGQEFIDFFQALDRIEDFENRLALVDFES